MNDWLSSLTQERLGLAGALLEILILSGLVFLVVHFMRGTRGAGIARGLILLYAVAFLAILFAVRILHLENLSWILQNLVGVSLIAIIIIFQPEIRRGLIHLSMVTGRFFGDRPGSIEKELSDAAVAISKRGEVGALFVVERQTQIGGYIESGVLLDAELSAQLLRTIFTKNTPLHDGAAIIRKGRIAAANCLLPLSENVEVCRGMGTRHRAAIGLTEETDAVVVVVSEETGAISVAMDGQMKRDLDYEGLQAFLREHCATVQEESLAGANGGAS